MRAYDFRSFNSSSTEAASLTRPWAISSSASRSFLCHSGVQNQSWSLGIRTNSNLRSTSLISKWSPFLSRKARAIRLGSVIGASGLPGRFHGKRIWFWPYGFHDNIWLWRCTPTPSLLSVKAGNIGRTAKIFREYMDLENPSKKPRRVFSNRCASISKSAAPVIAPSLEPARFTWKPFLSPYSGEFHNFPFLLPLRKSSSEKPASLRMRRNNPRGTSPE